MMKKYILISTVIFLVLSATLTAQPAAEMFDEFGWVPCEDLRSRLDNFLAALSNRPGSMGFVFVYEGKYEVTLYSKRGSRRETRLPVFGEAAHRTNIFRVHFGFRKFDPDRYLFIDGGFRDSYAVQMWIVPHGARPPSAKPTVELMTYKKGKFAVLECP